MSIWYISEKSQDEKLQKTAGVKARDDAEAIFREKGFTPVFLSSEDRTHLSRLAKLKYHVDIVNVWKEKLAQVMPGDTLFIQFPFEDHSIFLGGFFKTLQKKNIKVEVLIHDLDTFRHMLRRDVAASARLRTKWEEKVLQYCDHMIVHNRRMKEVMVRLGYEPDKLIPLGIFDYLIPGVDEERMSRRKNSKDMPVIIAGTLRRHKAAYAYDLPENASFHLYGVDYEGPVSDKIIYLGAFPPDDLPYEMEGSFGLVWDGGTSETCDGVFGKYLKINNPHKTSLYLASGIPVIIWKEAALAKFIEKKNCGITVSSLSEIPERVAALSEEDYKAMVENARTVGLRMRQGGYLSAAIRKALN